MAENRDCIGGINDVLIREDSQRVQYRAWSRGTSTWRDG
jgi:hypothetical protein